MPYFAFDVETTGLDPEKHEILQLGAILLDDDLKRIDSGQMKLMPKHWERADKEALIINKVDPSTWEPTHKSTKEALNKLHSFVNKYFPPSEKLIPLGHNVSFDLDFLRSLYKEEEKMWIYHYHKIDTINWAMLWGKVTKTPIKSYKLCDICELFNIKLDNAHDAMSDVKATVEIARFCINDLAFRVENGQRSIV
ncbi:MAG: 3'-5' exonuclease [Candidatus Heimdallarchaeaceae archaeon]|jgi:DNA polymerase-3 subunit epsilon